MSGIFPTHPILEVRKLVRFPQLDYWNNDKFFGWQCQAKKARNRPVVIGVFRFVLFSTLAGFLWWWSFNDTFDRLIKRHIKLEGLFIFTRDGFSFWLGFQGWPRRSFGYFGVLRGFAFGCWT